MRIQARKMPFTEEQMQQIYNTNLIDFAVQHGFEIEKGDRNTVHVKHSGGLYLFKHGRGYVCFSKEGSKGNIIDFVQEYMGAGDFKSAAEIILDCRAYEQTEHTIPPVEKKPRGELVLPEKGKNFDRTIAYLTRTRGIDKEIVYAMSHAALCKLNGIDWREDHRISEGCLSDKALSRYLQLHPEIREIVFCYDNDVDGKLADGTPHNQGQAQAEISAGTFTDLGYKCFIQPPQTKDFNQDLLTFRAMLQTSEKQTEKEAER